MELVLSEHDGEKRGWGDCSLLWLLAKLTEEVGELGRFMAARLYTEKGQKYTLGKTLEEQEETIRTIMREAADIGNVAMMIADVASHLLDERL
jgi:NTP pyrophosphatase (non-canonical NTP hydrolase)